MMNRLTAYFLLSLLLLASTAGFVLALFARQGVGVALFLLLLYVIYRRRDRLAALARSLDPVARWRGYRKARTYARMKDVWSRVARRHAADMRCPGCGVEIVVFNVTLAGRCSACGRLLID